MIVKILVLAALATFIVLFTYGMIAGRVRASSCCAGPADRDLRLRTDAEASDTSHGTTQPSRESG